MSEQVRRELLSDLKELRKLELQYQNQNEGLYQSQPRAYPLPPPQRNYLATSQFINQRPAAVYSSQIISPQYQPGVVQSRAYAPQIQSGVFQSQVMAAPLQSRAVVTGQTPLYSSNVVQQQNLTGSQVIKGESDFHYVPFEKVYYEHEEKKVNEVLDVKKKKTDYYAVEKQIEYVPYTTYETIQEVVPQQKTTYLEQQQVEYVPEVRKELVPVERLQEKVEYKPITRQVVHYPKFDKEFAEDAERSGKIVEKAENVLVGSQVIEPPRAAPLFSSQFVQSNIAPPQVIPNFQGPTQLVSSGVGVLPPRTSPLVSSGVLPPRTSQLVSSGVGFLPPRNNQLVSSGVLPQRFVSSGFGVNISVPPVNLQRNFGGNNLGFSGSWQTNRFAGVGGFQQRNQVFGSGVGNKFLGGGLESGRIKLSKKNPNDKFEKL